MKSLFSDKVYNILKWITIIVIPVLGEAYMRLAEAWGLPYATQVNETALVLTLVLGALIGISTIQYTRSLSSEDLEDLDDITVFELEDEDDDEVEDEECDEEEEEE